MPLIKINICQECLDGIGDECHTEGCALFLHKVDIPFNPDLYEIIKATSDSKPDKYDEKFKLYYEFYSEAVEHIKEYEENYMCSCGELTTRLHDLIKHISKGLREI